MTQSGHIGILATVNAGSPRLRPVEFSRVDGELWIAVSRRSRLLRDIRDGQHVEVVLIDESRERDYVRGVVHCSTHTEDRRRVWELQQAKLAVWCQSDRDPNLIVIRIKPDEPYGHS